MKRSGCDLYLAVDLAVGGSGEAVGACPADRNADRKQRFRPLFNQEGRAVSGIDPEPAVITDWPELRSKRLRSRGSKTLYI